MGSLAVQTSQTARTAIQCGKSLSLVGISLSYAGDDRQRPRTWRERDSFLLLREGGGDICGPSGENAKCMQLEGHHFFVSSPLPSFLPCSTSHHLFPRLPYSYSRHSLLRYHYKSLLLEVSTKSSATATTPKPKSPRDPYSTTPYDHLASNRICIRLALPQARESCGSCLISFSSLFANLFDLVYSQDCSPLPRQVTNPSAHRASTGAFRLLSS